MNKPPAKMEAIAEAARQALNGSLPFLTIHASDGIMSDVWIKGTVDQRGKSCPRPPMKHPRKAIPNTQHRRDRAMTYVVFKRTAVNWKQFSSNRKYKIQTRCSYEQAVNLCKSWNESRSRGQKQRGTVFEFMNTDDWNGMKGRKDA